MNSLSEALDIIRAHPNEFYVYVLHRPDGEPFYVGKGLAYSGPKYRRVARHEYDALHKTTKSYRLNIIRRIIADGQAVGYSIAGFFPTETAAFVEEKRLVVLYGRFDLGLGPLTNKSDGGDGGGSNPSSETRALVSAAGRRHMSDPIARERAVQAMHAPASRKKALASQNIAAKTPSYRAIQAKLSKQKWSDPVMRERLLTALDAARRDPENRRRQLEGIARTQADPEFHAKRNAGLRRPEVLARNRAWSRTPERRAQLSAIARASFELRDAERARAIAIANQHGALVQWPHHSCSRKTWSTITSRVLAGERVILI